MVNTLPVRDIMLRRDVWLAVGMVLFLSVFEVSRLENPHGLYLAAAGTVGGSIALAAWNVGIVAAVGAQTLFLWTSFVASRPWQFVYWLAFTAITFGQYGYIRATGSVLGAHDFSVALHSTQYWRGMASAFVDWSALVPSIVYAVALLAARSQRERQIRRLAIAMLVTGMIHSTYEAAGYLQRDPKAVLQRQSALPTLTAEAFGGTVTSLVWFNVARSLDRPRQRLDLTYRSRSAPSRHVVLIIDESMRADHLSLNSYKRPTTPWLEEIQRLGRVTNWGIAAAATADSTDSGRCLLTGLNLVPDRTRRSLILPTIFQFAKAMNYRTHLFDGGSVELREGLTQDDLRYVDDLRTQDQFGDDPDVDFRIARAVAQILVEPAGQFILLFKKGNHFPYGQNYPAGHGVWTPAASDGEPNRRGGAARVNDYDNAIRYNLDEFFRLLLGNDGRPPRAIVLYTSDHGQLLADRRDSALPGRSIAAGEVAVPLLMFGDSRPKVDVSYRASHHNLFATLLDLMEFPAQKRPAAYSRSLLEATGSVVDLRPVLAGELFGFGQVVVRDFDALANSHATADSETLGASAR